MPAPTFGIDYMVVNPADTVELTTQVASDTLAAIGDAGFTAAFSSLAYKFPVQVQDSAAMIRALYRLCKTYKDTAGSTTAVTGLSVTMSSTGYAPIAGYSGGTIGQASVVVKNAAGSVTYATPGDYTLVLNGDTLLVKRTVSGTIGTPPVNLLVNFNYTPVT